MAKSFLDKLLDRLKNNVGVYTPQMASPTINRRGSSGPSAGAIPAAARVNIQVGKPARAPDARGPMTPAPRVVNAPKPRSKPVRYEANPNFGTRENPTAPLNIRPMRPVQPRGPSSPKDLEQRVMAFASSINIPGAPKRPSRPQTATSKLQPPKGRSVTSAPLPEPSRMASPVAKKQTTRSAPSTGVPFKKLRNVRDSSLKTNLSAARKAGHLYYRNAKGAKMAAVSAADLKKSGFKDLTEFMNYQLNKRRR
tara:strand:- start:13338 stop:14093 length:756 start_codon:yes stop_codon:yes gene_type:complete